MAKVSGRPEGSVLTVEFVTESQRFVELNGGPLFTPAWAARITKRIEADMKTSRTPCNLSKKIALDRSKR
jgi:hypothetical protein